MKVCPHCGAELPDGAISCKECGSDKDTGWAEGAEYANLELPDYDEILENEFGPRKKSPSKIFTAIIAGILVLVLAVVFTGIL